MNSPYVFMNIIIRFMIAEDHHIYENCSYCSFLISGHELTKEIKKKIE